MQMFMAMYRIHCHRKGQFLHFFEDKLSTKLIPLRISSLAVFFAENDLDIFQNATGTKLLPHLERSLDLPLGQIHSRLTTCPEQLIWV
jgi:hypothetical protein